MTDKFVLSVGLAHELQHAFVRNGWTVEDVHSLCKGNTLSELRKYLLVPNIDKPLESIFLPNLVEECAKEAGIERGASSVYMKLELSGMKTVKDLVQSTHGQLMRIPHIGRKSVYFLQLLLGKHKLYIGMFD